MLAFGLCFISGGIVGMLVLVICSLPREHRQEQRLAEAERERRHALHLLTVSRRRVASLEAELHEDAERPRDIALSMN